MHGHKYIYIFQNSPFTGGFYHFIMDNWETEISKLQVVHQLDLYIQSMGVGLGSIA